MARAKKSKTKGQVRKWRDKPMNIVKPLNEYVVVCPGAQIQVKDERSFTEFYEFIMAMIDEGLLTLKAEEDNWFSMSISKSQHFPVSVMTLRRFDKIRAQANFANMGGQQGRPQ